MCSGQPTSRQASGLSERLREVVQRDYMDDHTASAKHLLKRGANPNGRCADGMTFLGEAITLKDHALVHYLIEFGVRVNARSRNGETPLVIAIRRLDTPLVRTLLASRAQVNQRDGQGGTPLMWAVLYPTPHRGEVVVQALLRHGARVNLRDQRGEMALDIATQCHDDPEILTLLWSAGARQ